MNIHPVIRGNGLVLELSSPVIMGVINLTHDSFYRGSRYNDTGQVIEKAVEMKHQGAVIIDVGAASSRPGSPLTDIEAEKNVLLPVLKGLRKELPDVFLSADTYNSETASAAFNEGVNMINDISGGTIDPGMFPFITGHDVAYVLMHIRGTPLTMQDNPLYADVVEEVYDFLDSRLELFRTLGRKDNIVIDPGFGFGKTIPDNYRLLSCLARFTDLGYPILAGLSRKSMIYRLLDTNPEEALQGTMVLNTLALLNGAAILRVHDVQEAGWVIRILEQYRQSTA